MNLIGKGYKGSLNGILVSDVSIISTPTVSPTPMPTTLPTPAPTHPYQVQAVFIITPILVLLALLLGVLMYFNVIDFQRICGKRFRKKIYATEEDDEDENENGFGFFDTEAKIKPGGIRRAKVRTRAEKEAAKAREQAEKDANEAAKRIAEADKILKEKLAYEALVIQQELEKAEALAVELKIWSSDIESQLQAEAERVFLAREAGILPYLDTSRSSVSSNDSMRKSPSSHKDNCRHSESKDFEGDEESKEYYEDEASLDPFERIESQESLDRELGQVSNESYIENDDNDDGGSVADEIVSMTSDWEAHQDDAESKASSYYHLLRMNRDRESSITGSPSSLGFGDAEDVLNVHGSIDDRPVDSPIDFDFHVKKETPGGTFVTDSELVSESVDIVTEEYMYIDRNNQAMAEADVESHLAEKAFAHQKVLSDARAEIRRVELELQLMMDAEEQSCKFNEALKLRIQVANDRKARKGREAAGMTKADEESQIFELNFKAEQHALALEAKAAQVREECEAYEMGVAEEGSRAYDSILKLAFEVSKNEVRRERESEECESKFMAESDNESRIFEIKCKVILEEVRAQARVAIEREMGEGEAMARVDGESRSFNMRLRAEREALQIAETAKAERAALDKKIQEMLRAKADAAEKRLKAHEETMRLEQEAIIRALEEKEAANTDKEHKISEIQFISDQPADFSTEFKAKTPLPTIDVVAYHNLTISEDNSSILASQALDDHFLALIPTSGNANLDSNTEMINDTTLLQDALIERKTDNVSLDEVQEKRHKLKKRLRRRRHHSRNSKQHGENMLGDTDSMIESPVAEESIDDTISRLVSKMKSTAIPECGVSLDVSTSDIPNEAFTTAKSGNSSLDIVIMEAEETPAAAVVVLQEDLNSEVFHRRQYQHLEQGEKRTEKKKASSVNEVLDLYEVEDM